MNKLAALTMLFVLLTLSLAHGQRSTLSQPVVFTHVTVIDAGGAPARPGMTVVIIGDRIADLGPTQELAIPKDARVVDATGKFLIPGLWDMHVHWYGYDKTYLRLFVANGVTGVRVMWGAPIHFKWRKEVEAGTLLGPRMVIASTILDGQKPIWPGSMPVANESQARQAVRKVKRDGYDFVKVYSLLPREAYFAISDETKKQGLQFAGHVPFAVSAGEASDAGQESIEHLTGVVAACSTRAEELGKRFEDAYFNPQHSRRLPSPAVTRPLNRLMLETFSLEKAAILFARLNRNRTWQCPTLTFLRSRAFINDPDFRNDPRLRYMPAAVRSAWDPSTDFRFEERTAEDFHLTRVLYQKETQLVGMMHRAGVEFLAGTDVSNPYCFPGFSLHDELALLVEAGLSPLAALQAATLNPARFLGKEKEVGTVEKGKVADLVLLEANPLADIRNTTKIDSVVLRGQLLDRKALDRLLAELEALGNQRK